jgi:hypothetical protein
MENEKRYRTLGREKIKDIKKDSDSLLSKYRKLADALGHTSELKVKREHGMLIFYVLIGE